MTRHVLIIFLLIGLIRCASVDNPATIIRDKNIIEEIFVDLNHDNLNDTITLLDRDTSGDPGFFKRIQITGKGLIPFELKANYAWDTIPRYLREENDKVINNQFLFLKRSNNSSYILLMGWQYSSGQEDFALIGISNNKSTLLTKENFNDVAEFEDLNNDGKLDIALNPTWSEGIGYIDSLGAGVATYAPYYVYTLTPNSFDFDSSMTRVYNQNNYAWAGLDSTDKVEVLYFRNEHKFKILHK